jgi:osmoprotectant transport system ATP-binding protein
MTQATEAVGFRNVSKFYGESAALRDVSFQVMRGETVAIIGKSGSGKSTCLKLVNRLLEADTGKICVSGEAIDQSDPSQLRRGIGYVIQEVGLFAHYTVAQNVGVVPELLGWSAQRRAARVVELLTRVGLSPDEYRGRYPSELSGGQRQRVGIARALAADPPLVLMDEPFGALDPITRADLQQEFSRLARGLDKTFLIVTHDIPEAIKLADRIMVLDQGKLVQFAKPAELRESPKAEVVRELFSQVQATATG